MDIYLKLFNAVDYDHQRQTYNGSNSLYHCLYEASKEFQTLPYGERLSVMTAVHSLIRDNYYNRPIDYVELREDTTRYNAFEYFYVQIDYRTLVAHVTDDFEEDVAKINIRDIIVASRCTQSHNLCQLIKQKLICEGVATDHDVVKVVEPVDESGSN